MSKVLSALGGALPDERPLMSLQIVESVAKCPTGYRAISRTYDEDADAGLQKQTGLFSKKLSHYICLSKSEGVPGYVMDGVVVVDERVSTPAGFSVAGRAGKRNLCTRVSRAAAARVAPPVTDVIVCSRMRQAPEGFILAGEINGKVVCYKVSGGSADSSPTHGPHDYENVRAALTPDNRRSRVAERPPKLSPLVTDLSQLSVSGCPRIEEFTSEHDYEALSPSYNIKPSRPAPRPPPPATSPAASAASPLRPARRRVPAPLPRASTYHTLGGHNGMEGVPFLLHPRLRHLPADDLMQLPSIKRRTRFDLDREYSYNFSVERQCET